MLVSPPAQRRVECVPALFIATLDAAGLLPPHGGFEAKRAPTLEEVSALTWLLDWGAGKVNGCASFVDRYDYHRGRDVREVVFITGSRRACYELLGWMDASARLHDRRLVGTIDERTRPLQAFATKMGFAKTRTFFEAMA